MKIEQLGNAHDAASAVQQALLQAGQQLSKGNDPNPQRWLDIARRLRVDPSRVTKHTVMYDHMDGPVQSWQVPVLIDPDQSPMYPVYELMTEAEIILEKSYTDSFFLAPAVLNTAPQA